MKNGITMLLTAASIILSSCSHQIMNFSVMSSSSVNYKYKDGAKSTTRIEGKGGTLDKAVNDALQKAGNGYDALLDGKVTMYHYSFILVWVAVFKVEGTPVRTKDATSSLNKQEFENWCKENNVILKSN